MKIVDVNGRSFSKKFSKHKKRHNSFNERRCKILSSNGKKIRSRRKFPVSLFVENEHKTKFPISLLTENGNGKRYLYIYSTDNYYDYRKKHNDIPLIKVGDTYHEDVIIRIEQQDTTSTAEKLRLMHSPIELPNGKRDKDVHHILEDELNVIRHRIDKDREWFDCDIDTVLIAVNILKKGIGRPDDFKMRNEQKDALEKALRYYFRGGDDFLFNAKMRFGKTHVAYQVMKSLGAKRILVLTYKPAVVSEWRRGLERHVDFDGYNFIHALEYDSENPIIFNGKNGTVLFASFQDILGEDNDGNEKRKWKRVINESYDFLIVDEVHFGAETTRAQKLLDSLHYKKRLSLSGTPLEILISGKYTEEQIYTWSYMDEQRKRNFEKKGGWKTEIYKWLPKMHIYAYYLGNAVKELAKYYNEEEGLTLNKFFASDDGITLKNASAVLRWLDLLASKSSRIFNSPFNRNELANRLNHLFWYLDSVNSVRALAKMLREHPFFSKYTIIIAADDNEGFGSDTLQIVQRTIRRNLKTITLSCGKLNTGVTIPEWTACFMLSDASSAETYWQTAFRVQSPYKDGNKLDCYIFDFNPYRALKMCYSYAEELAKHNQTTIASIREFLDTMEVLIYEDNELRQLTDVDEVISMGVKPEAAYEKFSSQRTVHTENLNDEIRKILRNVVGVKAKTITKNMIRNDGQKGKTFKNGKCIPTQKLTKNEFKGIVQKAIAVTQKLPQYLYISPENEESVAHLIKTANEGLFEQIVGITLGEFKIMIDTEFLDEYFLDRAIQTAYLSMK